MTFWLCRPVILLTPALLITNYISQTFQYASAAEAGITKRRSRPVEATDTAKQELQVQRQHKGTVNKGVREMETQENPIGHVRTAHVPFFRVLCEGAAVAPPQRS